MGNGIKPLNPLGNIPKDDRPKDHYVYLHRRGSSDGAVFYVGKGKGRRAWGMSGRSNSHWFRVANKYGVYVDILKDGLTKEQSLLLEIEVIKELGINNITNISYGGEGGQSGIENKRRKQVTCSNGMVFDSMTDAAYWLKSNGNLKARPGQISLCCSGKIMSSYGYVWSTDPVKNLIYKNPHQRRCKKVYCSNGMTFESLKSATEWVQLNLKETCDGTSISYAASGKMNSAFGLSWSYDKLSLNEYNEGRTVPKSISSEKGEVFKSVSDAVRWLRLNGYPKATSGGVCNALKGRYLIAYGRNWHYNTET